MTAGPPPPPQAAPAAPPVDDVEDDKKPAGPAFLVDPAKRFTMLGTLKVMALMFMAITAALNVVIMYNVIPEDQAVGDSPNFLMGVMFTVVAAVFGALAVFFPIDKKVGPIRLVTVFALIGPIMMIVGSGVGAMLLKVGEIEITDLFVALLFGLFLLLFIEYMSAVHRFWGIGRMAIERNLSNFDFNQVMKNYITFGFGMVAVILLVSLIVVFSRNILQMAMPDQFALSVEINSVYGLAISSAMIFSIIGIVLTFIFGGRAFAQDVKSVTAFSKEKLREMSEGSGSKGSKAKLTQATVVEVPKK